MDVGCGAWRNVFWRVNLFWNCKLEPLEEGIQKKLRYCSPGRGVEKCICLWKLVLCGDLTLLHPVTTAEGRVVGNIYRAIELAFREQLDGFTRCPACNGSGAATNMRSCIRNSISKDSHSLDGRNCWFCEGNGLLPLPVLRRFVPCDLPPIKTERSLSAAPFIKPFIHQINCSTQIKFQPCTGTKWGPFSPLKCPSWLADAHCDAASSVLYDKTTEFQEDMFLRPCPLHTAYRSVVPLISLLSSAISSHSANALASSANHSLGIERIKNDNDGLKDSDAVFQIGKEFGSYCKPHIQKRRNHLREKAVEEAERRARSILMALIPSEP